MTKQTTKHLKENGVKIPDLRR